MPATDRSVTLASVNQTKNGIHAGNAVTTLRSLYFPSATGYSQSS